MRLPSLKQITSLFREPPKSEERGYRDIVAVGGANSDWGLSMLSDDSDIWQNSYLLTARVRSLFRENPTFQKYRDLLWANIFGHKGIMLRMQVRETENRVVHSPDEKKALFLHEQRINRIRRWAETQDGRARTAYRAFQLADALERRDLETVIRGKAMVQIGAPDVYANQLIEAKRKEWQKAQYCDVRGRRSYLTLCQLRLISAVRDGDHFIRQIKDPRVNKFGYTLQLINAEWCDQFYNAILSNGNEVRRGIEYQWNSWGIGKAVAFYFIKRQPQDWQFSVPGAFNFASGALHERVDAAEIIHYCRPVDAEGTRPAPWVASVIPTARQLDQYALAEVIAAREEACKTGFYWSDVVPEGGSAAAEKLMGKRFPTEQLAPGERRVLPWGVKYQGNDPTHPTGNYEAFRKAQLRGQCAGMPGSDYNTIANDLENINFSAGRLGRLDTNEMSMLIQTNDIDVAECPIFESFLEMAMITEEIPFRYSEAKFSKLNRPLFQGRRWAGVDEVKEATASNLRVQGLLSSLGMEAADNGHDFEQILMEQAEERMMCDESGVPFPSPDGAPEEEDPDEPEEDENGDENPKPKPAKKKDFPKTKKRFNPHHDPANGEFTDESGAGGGSPAAATPATAAGLQTHGRKDPLSAHVKINADGRVKGAAEHALSAINKVHDNGHVTNGATLEESTKRSAHEEGSYEYGGGVLPKVALQKGDEAHPELTALHELGHYQHHQAFDFAEGKGGKFDSELKPWADVAKKADNVKELHRAAKSAKGAVGAHLKYLADPKEQFARDYSHYVALRSGDQTLLSQIHSERANTASFGHLAYRSDADMESVAQAFDKIHQAAGLK